MKKILLIITAIISAFTINAAQLTSVAVTNTGETFNYSNWAFGENTSNITYNELEAKIIKETSGGHLAWNDFDSIGVKIDAMEGFVPDSTGFDVDSISALWNPSSTPFYNEYKVAFYDSSDNLVAISNNIVYDSNCGTGLDSSLGVVTFTFDNLTLNAGEKYTLKYVEYKPSLVIFQYGQSGTINGIDVSIINSAFLAINGNFAVPEPATYAAIFGALALGFVAWRKRK